MASKIEWTDRTWNPVTGCTKISEGCLNCYAEPFAKRLSKITKTAQKYANPQKVIMHISEIEKPFKWKKPARIFVCSMSDLFHHAVKWSFIHHIMNTIEQNPQHTFIILTKRPENMIAFYNFLLTQGLKWPSNIWTGVTTENQKQFDARMPMLAQMPGLKFISVEPMLQQIDITPFAHAIHWIICGGEKGPNNRVMHSDWALNLFNQTQLHKIPFFFKQWGGNIKIDTIMGMAFKQFPFGRDYVPAL